MLKELFLLPAVLGCSLGGSASTAVRHNRFDFESDNNNLYITLQIAYGDFMGDVGQVASLSDSASYVVGNLVFRYNNANVSLTFESVIAESTYLEVAFYGEVNDFDSSLFTSLSFDFNAVDDIADYDDNFSFIITDWSLIEFDGVLSNSIDSENELNVLSIPAPSISQNGIAIVNEVVSVLVAGITTLGSGIGLGISNFAEALAFSNGELSTYFVLIIAFAGIALAIALTSRIFKWLTSLGN